MTKLLFIIFGAALLAALSLSAIGLELEMGIEQPVRAPICATATDAIKIAKADSEESLVKAREIFDALDDCDRMTALVTPRKVLYSGPTARGSTVRVVEIAVRMTDESLKTFYMVVDVALSNAGFKGPAT